jgi:hypothetical protein
MAILKKVRDVEHPSDKKHLVMPAFSFATDSANTVCVGLANMIIDAWNNVNFTYTTGGVSAARPLRDNLMDRDRSTKLPTQNAVDCATAYVQQTSVGLVDLKRAVVISELEHENDYVMQSDNEIVFVLPDQNRAVITPNPNATKPYPNDLLRTAQFLMACTPNGI